MTFYDAQSSCAHPGSKTIPQLLIFSSKNILYCTVHMISRKQPFPCGRRNWSEQEYSLPGVRWWCSFQDSIPSAFSSFHCPEAGYLRIDLTELEPSLGIVLLGQAHHLFFRFNARDGGLQDMATLLLRGCFLHISVCCDGFLHIVCQGFLQGQHDSRR